LNSCEKVLRVLLDIKIPPGIFSSSLHTLIFLSS
jgi:hypothetical protein